MSTICGLCKVDNVQKLRTKFCHKCMWDRSCARCGCEMEYVKGSGDAMFICEVCELTWNGDNKTVIYRDITYKIEVLDELNCKNVRCTGVMFTETAAEKAEREGCDLLNKLNIK